MLVSSRDNVVGAVAHVVSRSKESERRSHPSPSNQTLTRVSRRKGMCCRKTPTQVARLLTPSVTLLVDIVIPFRGMKKCSRNVHRPLFRVCIRDPCWRMVRGRPAEVGRVRMKEMVRTSRTRMTRSFRALAYRSRFPSSQSSARWSLGRPTRAISN